jgi:1-acyl-sn-glycerol-3-phosphate acyltransferase
MSDEFKIPFWVRVFRVLARPTFRGLFRILAKVQVEGLENLPSEGGYLVAGNHVSIYDPPFIVTFWPHTVEVAGAVAVLERPFQGRLMRMYGAMRVHRGEYNRSLLKEMTRRLQAGMPVLIMPEGRRSHSPGMQPAWHGTAYVAAKANAAVVPVGITGTDGVVDLWKRLRRPSMRMVIGKPLELAPVDLRSPNRKAELRQNTERIMYAIAALLPPKYQGVYELSGASID